MRHLSATLLIGSAMLANSWAHAATVAISCGAVGLELKLCQEGADAWAKKTGNQVKIVSTPEFRDRAPGPLSADFWRRARATSTCSRST